MAFRLAMLPPSNNALVRPAVLGTSPKGKPLVRLVSTREAREFREYARRMLPVAPAGGPLELFATFFVPTIASDVSNRLKALEDALTGRLWHDDKQVAEIHVRKVVTDEPQDVGVVLDVRPAVGPRHAELAHRLAKGRIGELDAKQRQQPLFAETKQVRPTAGGRAPQQPADAAAGGHPSPDRREVPESIRERIRRMAKPAVILPAKDGP